MTSFHRRWAIALAGAGIVAGAACSDTTGPAAPPDGGIADASVDRDGARPESDVEEVRCERTGADLEGDVPPAYAGRKNPLAAGSSSVIAAGRATFEVRCTLCHGATGKGDGPEGPADPRPADFTLRRRAEDYLFWRISLGGGDPPFCSAMPSYSYMQETARWQLVAFVRSLGPPPDGGPPNDAAAE